MYKPVQRVNKCLVCEVIVWPTVFGWTHSAESGHPHTAQPEWDHPFAYGRTQPVASRELVFQDMLREWKVGDTE